MDLYFCQTSTASPWQQQWSFSSMVTTNNGIPQVWFSLPNHGNSWSRAFFELITNNF